MLRGGSFDQSGASPRLQEAWSEHHEAEPSSADQIQEVRGTHKREPSCLRSIQVFSTGPGGIGKAVGEGFFDGTDVFPVVAPPCSTVEITGHQVHLFVKLHCTNCEDELLSQDTVSWRKCY